MMDQVEGLRKADEAQNRDDVFSRIFEAPYGASLETEAPSYVTWKMRDGTSIRIVDMNDRHLYNTIRMIERIADAKAAALNAAQADDTRYFEVTREQVIDRRVYHAMVRVAEARGIELSEHDEGNKKAEVERRYLAKLLKEKRKGDKAVVAK